MLEKDLWSDTPECVFPVSRESDSNKDARKLASNNTRMSDHCSKSSNIDTIGTEFCADDPMISERCPVVDSNSYPYSLGDISQTDDDFSFFDNDCEDKESDDLLDYGWPDIGNFEDIDRMFRSCDSTFGLGGIRSEEEFSWLTPSHTIEGSEDVLKSDFRFSCLESSPLKYMPDQQENSKHFSADDCNNGSSSMSYQSGFQASEGGESNGLGHLNFMNSSNAISERKNRFTPKEQNKSSYASNQLQSMERSGYSFEAPAITVEDKRGEAPNRQGYHASYSCNPKRADLVVHTSSCDPKSASKHIHHSQNGVENHSNIEGSSITTLADLDSSNVLASCCMSSGLDETSVEASSFLQLQQVMKQLDIRTKVCIRDSLYRLARSAEQRHRYAVNGGGIDDRETGGTNNCNGFMEIETNTNPIDRSIAHLLFHRPTDSSVATHDGSSLKSQTRVHGSISGPPVTTEKLACQEETAR